MRLLLRLAGVWGIADSLWLAFAPSGWARFWGGVIGKIGAGSRRRIMLLAAIEFAVSLALVVREQPGPAVLQDSVGGVSGTPFALSLGPRRSSASPPHA